MIGMMARRFGMGCGWRMNGTRDEREDKNHAGKHQFHNRVPSHCNQNAQTLRVADAKFAILFRTVATLDRRRALRQGEDQNQDNNSKRDRCASAAELQAAVGDRLVEKVTDGRAERAGEDKRFVPQRHDRRLQDCQRTA